MKRSATTHSVEETRAWGAALATLLEPGMTVLLIGDLGAGKTALTQGIAAGLGIDRAVTSPTFTMVASYEVDGRRGISTLLHADLYRVGSGVEADDLALGELVEDAAVAVVEWGNVAPELVGHDQLIVSLTQGEGDEDRILELTDERNLCNEKLAGEAFTPWEHS